MCRGAPASDESSLLYGLSATMTSGSPAAFRVALRTEGLRTGEREFLEAALRGAGTVRLADDEPQVVVARAALDVVPEITESAPVVVVIDSIDPRRTSEILAAGASGVVVVGEVGATLVPAVHAVACGLVAVPGDAREALRRPVLSTRENQILGLVVMGLTNAEVGRRLFIAESTVKYHLMSVYDKLGVRTRKQAAEMVLDPRTGIALGVLTMTKPEGRRGEGYSKPRVG